jgi:hypothetical protein
MSIRTIFAAAVLAASFASVAAAHDAVVTAQLQGAASQTQIIADSAVWNCADTACRAVPSHTISVRGCREFVRNAHVRVTAFGTDGRQLSADELARCNGEAPSTLQANAAGH